MVAGRVQTPNSVGFIFFLLARGIGLLFDRVAVLVLDPGVVPGCRGGIVWRTAAGRVPFRGVPAEAVPRRELVDAGLRRLQALVFVATVGQLLMDAGCGGP